MILDPSPSRAPGRSTRGRGRRAGLALAALATSGLVLGGCSTNFGAPSSATKQGENMLFLWRIFFVGALIVAALIWVLVLWSVIRYRRRKGQDDVPEQRQYNIPMEIFYTVTPIVVVVFLFAITMVATGKITANSTKPDLTVEVHGFQWQWRFIYQGKDVTVNGTEGTPPTLVLPVGETVRFDLISDDVIHSFWVPAFLEKRDLIPGQKNSIETTIKKPGEWPGRCAEYCGLDHWLMTFNVKAVTPSQFQAWLTKAAALPQPILAGNEPT